MVDLHFFTGKGEVGGNQILLSQKGEKLWLDFGLPFAKTLRYVNLLLEGKQLPKMRLSELSKEKIIPPTEFFEDELAVVISHAHHDHFGALFGPLEHDIKVQVFAPDDALSLIKAKMQVSAQGSLFGKSEIIPLSIEKKTNVKGFEIIPMEVDHSVDAAYSYLIFTPDGKSVYYSGDYRFDLKPYQKIIEEINNHTKKVDILITELTGVHSRSPLKEQNVENSMKDVSEKFEGFVVIFSTPSYTRRMLAIRSAFQDRELVIDSTYAYLLHVIGKSEVIDQVLITEKKAILKPWERELEKKFDVVTESDIKKRQKNIAVVLAPYHKLRLDFEFEPCSVAIVSLSEPFDEEGFTSQSRLENYLLRWRRTPVYYIHATGHAEAFEVARFIEELKPYNIYVTHSQSPEIINSLLPHRKNLYIPNYDTNYTI